jgi:hypothetical protein
MFSDLISEQVKFLNICKVHQINSLYVFGSAALGNFKSESDIDLLVEIDENDPIKRGELMMSLWDNFENYFKRQVDLLTQNSIRNPYLKDEIEHAKILIYDGKTQKIVC